MFVPGLKPLPRLWHLYVPQFLHRLYRAEALEAAPSRAGYLFIRKLGGHRWFWETGFSLCPVSIFALL